MPRTASDRSRRSAKSPKPYSPPAPRSPQRSASSTPASAVKPEPPENGSSAYVRKSSATSITITLPPRTQPILANSEEPWRHPDELEYIRPEAWGENEIIAFLCNSGFSIPGRPAHANEHLVSLTLRDGCPVVIPRGYRIPLMFTAKFQWESLRLVMTSAARDTEWEEYKFDILHVARLCKTFVDEARKFATLSGGTMDKSWRCPTMDRALVRYYQRWLINREEFVKDFWIEFEEEEYERDVLKNDWTRFVVKGHKGFHLTKEEVRNGLTYEGFTRGLGFVNGRPSWNTLVTTPRPSSLKAAESVPEIQPLSLTAKSVEPTKESCPPQPTKPPLGPVFDFPSPLSPRATEIHVQPPTHQPGDSTTTTLSLPTTTATTPEVAPEVAKELTSIPTSPVPAPASIAIPAPPMTTIAEPIPIPSTNGKEPTLDTWLQIDISSPSAPLLPPEVSLHLKRERLSASPVLFDSNGVHVIENGESDKEGDDEVVAAEESQAVIEINMEHVSPAPAEDNAIVETAARVDGEKAAAAAESGVDRVEGSVERPTSRAALALSYDTSASPVYLPTPSPSLGRQEFAAHVQNGEVRPEDDARQVVDGMQERRGAGPVAVACVEDVEMGGAGGSVQLTEAEAKVVDEMWELFFKPSAASLQQASSLPLSEPHPEPEPVLELGIEQDPVQVEDSARNGAAEAAVEPAENDSVVEQLVVQSESEPRPPPSPTPPLITPATPPPASTTTIGTDEEDVEMGDAVGPEPEPEKPEEDSVPTPQAVPGPSSSSSSTNDLPDLPPADPSTPPLPPPLPEPPSDGPKDLQSRLEDWEARFSAAIVCIGRQAQTNKGKEKAGTPIKETPVRSEEVLDEDEDMVIDGPVYRPSWKVAKEKAKRRDEFSGDGTFFSHPPHLNGASSSNGRSSLTSSPADEHFMLSAAAWTSDSGDASPKEVVQPPPLPSPVPLRPPEPRGISCHPNFLQNQGRSRDGFERQSFTPAPSPPPAHRSFRRTSSRFSVGGRHGSVGIGGGTEGEEGSYPSPVVTKIVSVFRDTLEGLSDILTTVGREEIGGGTSCSPGSVDLNRGISRRRSFASAGLRSPGASMSISTAPYAPLLQSQPEATAMIGELLGEIQSLRQSMQEDAERRAARDLEVQRLHSEMDDLRRQVFRMDRERRISQPQGGTPNAQQDQSASSSSLPSPATPVGFGSPFSYRRRESSAHPLSHLLADTEPGIDVPVANGLTLSRDPILRSSPPTDWYFNAELQYPAPPPPIAVSGLAPVSPSTLVIPNAVPAPQPSPPSSVLTPIPPLDAPLPIKSQRKHKMMLMHQMTVGDKT